MTTKAKERLDPFSITPFLLPNKGRADMTIILPDKVYVIELKVDQPGKALEQIKEKGYHEKYLADGRKVYIFDNEFRFSRKKHYRF